MTGYNKIKGIKYPIHHTFDNTTIKKSGFNNNWRIRKQITFHQQPDKIRPTITVETTAF